MSGVATTSTSGISGAGLKKCRPEDVFRDAACVGDVGDAQRAGVRGEDGVAACRVTKSAKDRLLELDVLQRGLDDQVRLEGQTVERVSVMERVEHLLAVVGRQLGLCRPASESVGDAGAAALDRGMVDVVQLNLVTGLQADLGDTRAHGPGADDADVQGPRF